MRALRFLMTVAALTGVYCLTLASFDPWDIAFGAVLATILLGVSSRFIFSEEMRGPSPIVRFFAFFPFALGVLWQVLTGTVQVVSATIGLRRWPTGGVVEVPIGERSSTAVAVWAVITGLPPGSFFVDVDDERRSVLIHLFDASDPEGYRRRVQAFYRRFQSKVFP